MAKTFSESGLTFQYPENWTVEREEIEGGWTVTVQSSGTAFFLICRRDDNPPSTELANEMLAELETTYPGLESEPGSTTLAGRVAHGHDARFFLFDLTNTCWLRTFRTADATLLVMWQVNDLEMDTLEPVLRAIGASLKAT